MDQTPVRAVRVSQAQLPHNRRNIIIEESPPGDRTHRAPSVWVVIDTPRPGERSTLIGIGRQERSVVDGHAYAIADAFIAVRVIRNALEDVVPVRDWVAVR